MLKIGKLTDYAVLILSQMAREPAAVLSATYLADMLHLSSPTVSKILKILADAGLVSSTRGVDGGYRLTRSGAHITVADIIASMEGELAVTECCECTSRCTIDSLCSMQENWQKINQMVQALLARVTIIDMLEPLSLAKTFPGVINNDK